MPKSNFAAPHFGTGHIQFQRIFQPIKLAMVLLSALDDRRRDSEPARGQVGKLKLELRLDLLTRFQFDRLGFESQIRIVAKEVLPFFVAENETKDRLCNVALGERFDVQHNILTAMQFLDWRFSVS